MKEKRLRNLFADYSEFYSEFQILNSPSFQRTTRLELHAVRSTRHSAPRRCVWSLKCINSKTWYCAAKCLWRRQNWENSENSDSEFEPQTHVSLNVSLRTSKLISLSLSLSFSPQPSIIACPDDYVPHTRTHSFWSWRRNFISIDTYAGHDASRSPATWTWPNDRSRSGSRIGGWSVSRAFFLGEIARRLIAGG